MGGLDRREGEWLDLVADLLASPMWTGRTTG